MHSSSKNKIPDYSLYGGIICCLGIFFYLFDYFIQVSPSVMTHQIMEQFKMNASDLGILGACFYYAYLLMQVPAGILLDRFGARIMLSLAILVCASGVLIFAITANFYIACLGRFLTGIGSAFAFISTVYLIANWFSHRYFAALIGIAQSGAALGSLFGLIPLAYGVNHFGWQPTLLYIGWGTLALFIVYWLVIRDRPPQTQQKADKSNKPHASLKTILAHKQLWFIAALGFCSWVPVATIGTLWGVPFLVSAYHITTVQAGELCAVFWIGLGCLSPIMGWFSDVIQRRKTPLMLCFGIGLIASLGLLYATKMPIWIGALSLLGLSLASCAQALTFAVVKDQVPRKHLGYASGFNNMAAVLGGAVAQPLVGGLLYHYAQQSGHRHTSIYSIAAYQHALLVLPIALLVGLIMVVFFIKETHGTFVKNTHEPHTLL